MAEAFCRATIGKAGSHFRGRNWRVIAGSGHGA